tara:strand:+ start:558 stop:989 length:432 start_codon:yes stop_codon:yes gene_type:complete
MKEVTPLHELVAIAVSAVHERYLKEKEKIVLSPVRFSSSTFGMEIALEVAHLINLEPDTYMLYFYLSQAFKDEADLLKQIDKQTKYFVKLKRWSSYQHAKHTIRAVNRILNDHEADRKKQLLFIILSYEITYASLFGEYNEVV